MNDSVILIVGIVVFGLMLIAMILTVIEFKRIVKEDNAKLADSKRDSDDV